MYTCGVNLTLLLAMDQNIIAPHEDHVESQENCPFPYWWFDPYLSTWSTTDRSSVCQSIIGDAKSRLSSSQCIIIASLSIHSIQQTRKARLLIWLKTACGALMVPFHSTLLLSLERLMANRLTENRKSGHELSDIGNQSTVTTGPYNSGVENCINQDGRRGGFTRILLLSTKTFTQNISN